MIKLAGAVSLAFNFPAPLPLAFAYYTDLKVVLPYLPYIELAAIYDDNNFRCLYSATEFGGYSMDIYCDIQTLIEEELNMLRIIPSDHQPPVESSAGVNSSTARGYFSSRGLFFDEGGETRIEYEFELRSHLPRPMGMRLMPSRMVNGIAKNVAKIRMREIAQGFIERSVAEFPAWLEAREIACDNGQARATEGENLRG